MNLEQQGELLRAKWARENFSYAKCCGNCAHRQILSKPVTAASGCRKMSKDIGRPVDMCYVWNHYVCPFFKSKSE